MFIILHYTQHSCESMHTYYAKLVGDVSKASSNQSAVAVVPVANRSTIFRGDNDSDDDEDCVDLICIRASSTETCKESIRLAMVAKNTLTCKMANSCPIQARGPTPNNAAVV